MTKLSTVRGCRCTVLGMAMAIAAPLMAQAPSATLAGIVRDSAGHPVPGVEVWLRGTDLHTITADNGGFRLSGAPPGAAKVSVRRMGYEPTTVALQLHSGQTDSLLVSLNTVATSIAGMAVEEEEAESRRLLSGFWDRRSHGFGHYFTRAEIEAKNASDFTDIVRMTPGVSIVTVGGRKSIRFSRNAGVRGDCPPQYWVDGMRIENATPDEFPPGDVEAVEVYAGISTIPQQFAPKTFSIGVKTCGAIVIWTRLPGS